MLDWPGSPTPASVGLLFIALPNAPDRLMMVANKRLNHFYDFSIHGDRHQGTQ
jgi:hypothetical protein